MNNQNNINSNANNNVSESLNNGINQTNINNNQNVNNKPNNKNNKVIIIIIMVVVLLIIVGSLMFNLIISNLYYVNENNEKITEEIITTQPAVTTEVTSSKLKECSVKPITIEGKNEAEKVLEKLIHGDWNYIDNGNISSNKLDTYYKVSATLYNLGYFDDSISDMVTENGCTLSKEIVDKEMAKIFNNTEYNPLEFKGNNCLPLAFEYDSQNRFYKVRSANGGGCGSGGAFAKKIYDEKEQADRLTFKTKVLMYSVDGISNLDSNNNFKDIVTEVSNDVTYENVIDKYESYANIYEWTFVKNKNGEYVFDNIKRIK